MVEWLVAIADAAALLA